MITKKPGTLVIAVLTAFLVSVATSCYAQTESDGALRAGDALNAAFKSYSVVGYRGYVKPGARGIAQSSFLDLDGASKNIQVAFVIDGTSSMSKDIDSLRTNVTAVVEGIRSQVTSADRDSVFVDVAVVVYRDFWEGMDPVTNESIPRKSPVESYPPRGGFLAFNDDDERSELLDFLSSIETGTGSPAFAEQVDRGLDAALKLNWSPAPGVTKVIFLAGDAPPYEEKLVEPGEQPKWWSLRKPGLFGETLRGFTTDDLIKRACDKKISVHTVSCDTSVTDAAVLNTELPRARAFFQAISSGTGGGLLDLRDKRTVERLVQISAGRAASLVELKKFKVKDLEAQAKRSDIKPVKVAFLPLVPLEQLDYRDRFSNPAYQMVSSVARTVRELDASLASSGDDVRRAWMAVKANSESAEKSVLLGDLASKLDADFIVSGKMSSDGNSATIEVTDAAGVIVSTETVGGVSISQTRPLWDSVSSSIKAAGASGNADAIRFVSLAKEVDAEAFDKYSGSPESLSMLNEAYMKLEEAAAFPRGQSEGVSLTREAVAILEKLIAVDDENAAALMLLASCAVNLDRRDDLVRYLTTASNAAAKLAENDVLRLEIEGDYELYVTQEPGPAIDRYTRLGKEVPELSKTALRVNWTLAGIYLGDWGLNPDKLYSADGRSMQSCQDNARSHILAILANWPDSPEARFYGRYADPPVKLRRGRQSDLDDTLVAEQIEYQIRVPAARPTVVTAGLLDWRPPGENQPSISISN